MCLFSSWYLEAFSEGHKYDVGFVQETTDLTHVCVCEYVCVFMRTCMGVWKKFFLKLQFRN